MINWINLENENQLADIIQKSFSKPVIIFKHSTQCSISISAKSRIERQWKNDFDIVDTYFLDLLKFRPISNQIAKDFEVEHQSPQVLVIKNGKSVFNTSHMNIQIDNISPYF